MTEKYKIYVPEEMKSRLENDAGLFEFTKKDGTVNLNAFLKELIVNYFDQYQDNRKQLLDTILSDLEKLSSISAADVNVIADRIINGYMRSSKHSTARNTAITLTLSRRSLDIMRSIENNLLGQISLSQYINDMLESYLSIARSDREKIIFKEVFEALNDAIKKNRIITFSSTSVSDMVFTIRPYMIAASKEEQCNYLLCTDNRYHQPRTFRISRIRALYTTSDCFTPNEKVRKRLMEIAIRNPQSASKNVRATVILTELGIRKFHMITKNRPDISKREGNVFYFDWPKKQLEDYFGRFGEEAVIVSPLDCRLSMTAFYSKALEAYKKTPNTDIINV